MVQIVAHKGANERRPENTRAAAQLCVEWGVEWVEVDVNTSADGIMYLMHGPRIDATTDGEGVFRELDSSAIDALDAGAWFSPEWAGERVPRLDAFLRWIKGKAKVFLDVKRADHAALVELIYSLEMQDDVFFWSGVPGWQQRLLVLEPRLRQKHNISSSRSAAENERAKRGGGGGGGGAADTEGSGPSLAVLCEQLHALKAQYGDALYCVEVSLADFSPELQHECHERGVLCMVMHCPSVKDPEGFAQIAQQNADMINLDHADLFLEVAARVQTDGQEQDQAEPSRL
jgi:hypothetical protein